MASSAALTSPPAHLLSGHLPNLRRDPLGYMLYCARTYGDLVPLRFGPARVLLASHPDYVEQIFVTRNAQFIKDYWTRDLAPLTGNGLLNSHGEFWLRQRRLVQPAFHRKRIAAYGQIMVSLTEQALAGWQPGQVHDVHAAMMGLTLRIVAKALFDADLASDVATVGTALRTALQCITERDSSLMMLVPYRIPTPGNLRLKRAVRRLDAIVYRIIEERRAETADRGDLLSTLLEAQDEDGSHMTDTQLRDEVMTLLLAGHETTALALTWTFHLLAHHPAAEAALLAELQTVLNGRPPTVDDVPHLRYAEAIIFEALRLYPPAWSIAREAAAPVELGGSLVPRGTTVITSQWVVHRDPRFYDEPDAFRPERWLDGLAKRLPRFAYFPFGGGPRLCIGQSFAMLEAVLLLATIAQRLRYVPVAGYPVVPSPAITLRPLYGLPMTPHNRA